MAVLINLLSDSMFSQKLENINAADHPFLTISGSM